MEARGERPRGSWPVVPEDEEPAREEQAQPGWMMAVRHEATRAGVEEEVAPARARQAERQVGPRIGRVPAAVVVVHVLPRVGGMEREERSEQEEQQRRRQGRELAP